MKYSLTSFLVVLFFSLTAHADIVVDLDIREPGAQPKVGKMYIQGKNFRMKAGSNKPGDEMIYRGAENSLITINSKKKEYTAMTKADMKMISSKMDSAMAEMEQQLANVPPQQRAMMEKMLSGMMGKMGGQKKKSKVLVRNTGEKAKLAGYSCIKYEVTRNGNKTRDYWVASPGDIKGGAEMRTAFDSMSGFFDSLMESLSSTPIANMIDNPYIELSQIDGIPMKTVQFKDGKVVGETIISSITPTSLESTMFQAPAGYKQKDFAKELHG